MRIVFMGTPDFAMESLNALVEAGHDIKLVITTPDRPKGRGMKVMFSPVKEYALSKNLEVLQPIKIRNNNEIIERIKEVKPDVICVVAYGKILPIEILSIPDKGCVNVHGSLLPKYRGAAPIQWAVLNGDKVTGITTMYINEKMDEGDMLLKEEVEIDEDETFGDVWQKLSKIGAKLLVKTLDKIAEGSIISIKQEGQGEPTYAPMLDKEMARIDWENKNALEIKNLVRGLNPIIGAYTFINEKKYKFWKVDVIKNTDFLEKFKLEQSVLNEENGTIIIADDKKGLFIKAKDAVISVLEIQAENSKKMNVLEFLRGNNF